MDRTTSRTPGRMRKRGSSRVGRGTTGVLAAPLPGILAALVLLGSLAGSALGAEGPGYPLTLVDDEGTSVTLDAPPERVIGLSPAITETAFALGAGELLVGGTDADDFPVEAAALPDAATFTGVIMEQIVALEPDLVIAGGRAFTPADDIARMRELGIPVVVVYAESVEGVLADIELIGAALGRPEEAADLVAGMRERMAVVSEALEAIPERPRTFYEILFEPQIWGPAPGSFIADMVALAGGDPVTTDPDFSIPLERLIVADPEIIALGDAVYGICPEHVLGRPGWSDITAVKEGAIRPVDDIVVTRPGPRLPDGLASLARAIHPDIELPGFAPERPICVTPSA